MRHDHPNAETVRKAMSGMSSGPVSLGEFLAEDVVWHEVGNPEPIRGRQAVLEAMSAVSDRVSFDYGLYDVLADDGLAIAYGRADLRAGDRTGTYDSVEITRLRDGKVVERWAMVGDQEAMRAFWEGL